MAAFDSVDRDAIWGLLWAHVMPEDIVGLMKLLYLDTLSAVRTVSHSFSRKIISSPIISSTGHFVACSFRCRSFSSSHFVVFISSHSFCRKITSSTFSFVAYIFVHFRKIEF